MDELYINVLIWVANCLSLVFVVFFPLAYVLRKADEGVLDLMNAFIAILVLMGLMLMTGLALGTGWVFVILAVELSVLRVLRWWEFTYPAKLHRQLDERFFEKCRLAIAFDPRNAGSHALLADACAHEGRHAEAVKHYEIALTLAPDPETNAQYDRWVRRLEAQRTAKRKCGNVFPWWRLRV